MTEKSALCRVISISREAYKLIYGGAEINSAALDLLSNALSHAGNAERPLKSLMRPLKRELKSADKELFSKAQRFFSPLFSGVDFDEKRAARLVVTMINGSDSICAMLSSNGERARDMAQAMSGLCGYLLGEYDGIPKERIYPLLFGYYEKRWGESFLPELSDML